MCTSISPRAVQGQICKPLLCCREGVGGWVIRGRYITHTQPFNLALATLVVVVVELPLMRERRKLVP